ncbi:MAG TPA: TetR family transcriptional regulator, partial [Lachnospiraceae bacterium]|nr:TetR family transcriptional regulator [Lachnospiraceae bacterium]
GTLCATQVCYFSDAEIEKMITEIFISLLEKMKRGEM